ncbi:hypothetical protein I8J29_24490 [Paenibacillus sp. MWE-103]|uniref:YqbQ/XkdQ domain-containing protein n=1 Tax=Paenibacillus artemisiicola TaxID=1172618 RepID=A0ABS3WGB1_9BACL|nr:hypothetical protein [Paenibacillus artemisiicola]MBO7747348.1 hypothetical protein [Paenibacillus artemisiicola]
MAHRLAVTRGGRLLDFTELAGNIAWSSHMDTLGEELSFSYAANDAAGFPSRTFIQEGDVIALLNGHTLLRQYVVTGSEPTGRFGKNVTCYDFAWYLNKNETVIQFKKISVSSAIAKLCEKFGIKHDIVSIKTLVTKIYKGDVVSEILTDLLDQAKQETGTAYYMEMNGDTLTVRSRAGLLIKPMIRLSDRSPLIPVSALISESSRSTSIEDMKNKVLVASEDEESVKVFAEAADSASVVRYGQLTQVVTLEGKNAAQARQIAKTALAEANRVHESCSLTLPGHDDIKAGRMMDFNEPITGIVGRYLITSASHSVAGGIHKVSVELEATA